jgi:hypothetical protein
VDILTAVALFLALLAMVSPVTPGFQNPFVVAGIWLTLVIFAAVVAWVNYAKIAEAVSVHPIFAAFVVAIYGGLALGGLFHTFVVPRLSGASVSSRLQVQFTPDTGIERIGSQLRGTFVVRNVHSELSLENVAVRIGRIDILTIVKADERQRATDQIARCLEASVRRTNDPISITRPFQETLTLLAAGASVPFTFANIGDSANVIIELARNNVQYVRGVPNHLSDDCVLPRGRYRVSYRAEAKDVAPQVITFVLDNSADAMSIAHEM